MGLGPLVIDSPFRDVDFVAPFVAITDWTGTHTTYLDTVGRPKLTFQYKNLTPKHGEHILVSLLFLCLIFGDSNFRLGII